MAEEVKLYFQPGELLGNPRFARRRISESFSNCDDGNFHNFEKFDTTLYDGDDDAAIFISQLGLCI